MSTVKSPENPGVIRFIDHFKLKKKLGQGAFAAVWEAEDTETSITVALKFLPNIISHNSAEMENIKENFRLVVRLAHPNIATVRALHKVENISDNLQKELSIYPKDYIIVMDMINGSTINLWRKQFPNKKLNFDLALHIISQLADALDYAHSEDIIHRDIKPENIIITRSKQSTNKANDSFDNIKVKLLDFGIASEINSSISRLTDLPKSISGTRPYMPPEQWEGKTQNAKTDQYALAILFYDLIHAEVPFASIFASSDTELMKDLVLHKTPEKIPELNASQNQLLLKALSKSPEDRFESCSEFVTCLQNTKHIPNKTTPIKTLLYILIIIAILITFFMFNQEKQKRKQLTITKKEHFEKIKEVKAQASQTTPTQTTPSQTTPTQSQTIQPQTAQPQTKVIKLRHKLKNKPLIKRKLKKILNKIKHKKNNLNKQTTFKTKFIIPYINRKMMIVKHLAFIKIKLPKNTNLKFPFWISKYEVTQKDWEIVMRTSISQLRDKADKTWPLWGVGDDYPVYYVSWQDASNFCKKLTNYAKGKLNIPKEYIYRLPTKNEWEYATGIPKIKANFPINETAWFSTNSSMITHQVGQKAPNILGLYDMLGNVAEWCLDDSKEPITIPPSRIFKGGAWNSSAKDCNIKSNPTRKITSASSYIGFRIVLAKKL